MKYLGTFEFETYRNTVMTAPETRYRDFTEVPTYSDVVYVRYDGVKSIVNVLHKSGEGEMTDIVTPKFHQRVRDGEVINNPCNRVVKSYEIFTGDASLLYYPSSSPSNWWRLESGCITARLLANPSYQPYLFYKNDAPAPTFDTEGQAKSFALARVDSTPYEFAEDVGELRETLQFLKNPLDSIASLAKVYKQRYRAIKRNPKFKENPAREAKALADLWNTYSFAFAPLVRSIMSACEAWNHRDRLKRPARRSSHGYSQNTERSSDVWTRAPEGAGIATYNKNCSRTVETHATIYYEVSNPLVNWQFALGLRLKDIPKTMWNLMPLSFMVDRMFNLSNAIAGISNLTLSSYTVSILAASVTQRYTSKHTMTLSDLDWSTGAYTYIYSGSDYVQWTEFEYDRKIWVPKMTDAFPPVTGKGLVDSITKTADLIALILSRLL